MEFVLDPVGRSAFADLTGDMIGEELVVSLCGRTLVQAVVRERFAGVRGIINLPTPEAATVVAEVLHGNLDCPDLERHLDQ